MRRTILTLLAIASPAIAQQQQSAPAANVSVNSAKGVWQIASSYVLRSAEQMPESLYSYQPTKDVRTFGQLIGHVADAEYMFCAAALGEKSPATGSFEKSATSKAALVQGMKDAGAYCQRAYAQNDAASAEAISLFGMNMTKLGALIMNGAHDYEHYGNLVTYFRLKGMVPPSSAGR